MLKYLLCFRYLCKIRLVIISVLAVALSFGLLVSIASVFSGFIDAVENGASSSMGDIVIRPHPSLKITDQDVLINRLKQIPQIHSASALLTSQGLILIGKGDVKKADIWGIDLDKQDEVTGIKQHLCAEPKDYNENSVIVGVGILGSPDAVTDEYDIPKAKEYIGKNALILTGRIDTELQNSFVKKDLRVTINNIIISGIDQFDRSSVYVPLETLSKALYPDKGIVADTVQVRFIPGLSYEKQLEILKEVKDVWRSFAINKMGWPAGWVGYSSVELAKDLQRQMVQEYRKQMDVLMAVFSIVSCGIILLIFCIFYMIVLGRRKDIAIIRSCGHSRSSIAFTYISFGLLTAVAGIALGLLLGWLFTENINAIEASISRFTGVKIWKSSVYMFSRIPNKLDLISAFKISIFALISSIIGAAIPAMIAAKTDPVKTLRYE